MGNFIKIAIQFTVFVIFLGSIGWFIAYNTNPYAVCEDHPSKKMKKTHFICKPFGLVMEKPEPEKKFRDGKF